jgi:hypothetical protein
LREAQSIRTETVTMYLCTIYTSAISIASNIILTEWECISEYVWTC